MINTSSKNQDRVVENEANKVPEQGSANWAYAIDWSSNVAPDSTTDGDTPMNSNIIDAESCCSSDIIDEDDANWKRKRNINKRNEVMGHNKKVKLWIDSSKFEDKNLC